MRSFRGVLAHGLVVLALVVMSAPLLLTDTDTDFGTWGAMMLVVAAYGILVALGAPWSLLWFASDALGASEAVSQSLFLPLVLGGACLNVVLHYYWRRRQLRSADLQRRSETPSAVGRTATRRA